jgi:hypothetical protein
MSKPLAPPSFARALVLFAVPILTVGAIACGNGGSGEDDAESQSAALTTAPRINIGFGGMGHTAQQFEFSGITKFFDASVLQESAAHPRICHVYLPWNVGFAAVADPKSEPEKQVNATKADFEDYLRSENPNGPGDTKFKNPCEDVLVSFKGTSVEDNKKIIKGEEPSGPDDDPTNCPHCFGSAVRAFLRSYWSVWATKGRTFSFTAWNEPNNPGLAGNGIGTKLSAERAAAYFLVLQNICNEPEYGCKVAAGDMESNGGDDQANGIHDYETHCDADIGSTPCPKASWLDSYKAAIAKNAKLHGLKEGFRPAYWAFHGWQEMNQVVYYGLSDPCKSDPETKCAMTMMQASLKGTWSHGELWDTETGVAQKEPHAKTKTSAAVPTIGDELQAKGAAYLLDVSQRGGVTRIYYQGVEPGPWKITCGGKPRPSFCVLANRYTTFPEGDCTYAGKEQCAPTPENVNEELAEDSICGPGLHPAGDAGMLDLDAGGSGLVVTGDSTIIACEPDAPLVQADDAGTTLVGGGGLVK